MFARNFLIFTCTWQFFSIILGDAGIFDIFLKQIAWIWKAPIQMEILISTLYPSNTSTVYCVAEIPWKNPEFAFPQIMEIWITNLLNYISVSTFFHQGNLQSTFLILDYQCLLTHENTALIFLDNFLGTWKWHELNEKVSRKNLIFHIIQFFSDNNR
jgi:hypothetical protein